MPDFDGFGDDKWQVQYVDRSTGATLTVAVTATSDAGARAAAPAQLAEVLRWEFDDDAGDPLPDEPDWFIASVLPLGRRYASEPASPAGEPPAEWELALDDVPAQAPAAQAPADPSDQRAWNALLATEDLAVAPDAQPLDQLEAAEVPDSHRRRGAARPHSAVWVRLPDGTEDLQDVRGDAEAVRKWLDRHGHLDAYRRAVSRGRVPADHAHARAEARDELGREIAVLVDDKNATVQAIAKALGCHREAVARLTKNARR